MAAPLIFNWPRTFEYESARNDLRTGAIISTSRYTGTTRGILTPNTPWLFSVVLHSRYADELGELRAFIRRLQRGGIHYVKMFDPAFRYPYGTAAGINQSNFDQVGIGQFSDSTLFSDGTGFRDGALYCRLARNHIRGENSVLLTDLVPDQSISIKADDMMEIGGYLHAAVESVASDANGEALVPIVPSLRVDVIANSPDGVVNFDHPSTPCVLSAPGPIGLENIRSGPIGLDFVEVLP